MSTTSFQARISRIEQPATAGPTVMPRPAPKIKDGARTKRLPRRGRITRRRFLACSIAAICGGVVGVLLSGALDTSSAWGPGTDLNAVLLTPTLIAMMLAPLFVAMSMFVRNVRPGILYASLSYFLAIVVLFMV
ncbi:MAG: hypothetical protein WBC93_07415 [Sulfitobacter sp.]